MKKRTLSVIILAKNEELMIADCIRSVAFADEIIVIDNESTDATVEIAKKLKAKVISTNASSFSLKREMGLQKSTSVFVLYLDADERLSKELADEIISLLSSSENADAYVIRRQNYYLGTNPWPKIESFARLFRRSSLKGWKGELHETPIYSGNEETLSGCIQHFTHRDFASMVAKTNTWSDTEAALRFNASHPQMTWWRFPRVMIGAFYDSFIKQQGFRAGKVGFLESVYQSFSIFITYAKLWELQHAKKISHKDTHR